MSKWIATKDKLPEPNKPILTANKVCNMWVYEVQKYDPYSSYYSDWYGHDGQSRPYAPDYYDGREDPRF